MHQGFLHTFTTDHGTLKRVSRNSLTPTTIKSNLYSNIHRKGKSFFEVQATSLLHRRSDRAVHPKQQGSPLSPPSEAAAWHWNLAAGKTSCKSQTQQKCNHEKPCRQSCLWRLSGRGLRCPRSNNASNQTQAYRQSKVRRRVLLAIPKSYRQSFQLQLWRSRCQQNRQCIINTCQLV